MIDISDITMLRSQILRARSEVDRIQENLPERAIGQHPDIAVRAGLSRLLADLVASIRALDLAANQADLVAYHLEQREEVSHAR